MIVWPPLAVILGACMAVVLVAAWLLIPFGTIKPTKEGGHTLAFPWSDDE